MNFVFAQSHYRYVNDLKTDVYFGHISYTEVQLEMSNVEMRPRFIEK